MAGNSECLEDYKIVAWAINTTGDEKTDEICELSAYTPELNFHEYIMPYCDVKSPYWKWHGLRECNTNKLRFLVDCNTNKILHTKTEFYGLKDFLLWLEKVNGQSSNGVILICFDDYNYMHEILLQSIRRYNLNKQFSNIVKGFVNCYNICEEKYRNNLNKCTLRNVSKMLLHQDASLIRAVTRAEICYKILVHIQVDRKTHNSKNSLFYLIKPYICNSILDVPDLINQTQVLMGNTLVVKEHVEVDVRQLNLNNEGLKLQDNKSSSILRNFNKYNIVSWAINTTGSRFTDRIFQIAALSLNSDFNQFIIPKKYIGRSYFKHNIRVVKIDGIRNLKNLQTKELLNTKSEVDSLKEFIMWLVQAKEANSEGIVLLYHEQHKHSIMILLETLRRCNLKESFSSVVKGFVNIYPILEDTYADVVDSFTLNKISKLILKKNVAIGDALIRAQISYEVIRAVIEDKQKELSSGSNKDITQKSKQSYEFIEPYVNVLSKEEREVAEIKAIWNTKKKSKSKNPSLVKHNTNQETQQ